MRRSLALLVAVIGLLLAAPAAFAETEVFTITEQNVTEEFTDVLPCVGTADITITYNAVFHVTELDDGTFHMTGTLAGSFTAVVDDVTYSGRFAQWFGENSNRKSFAGTFTFHVVGSGSDGSTVNFQETAHFSVSAKGLVLEFDKTKCA
jgi:hypothetical protein